MGLTGNNCRLENQRSGGLQEAGWQAGQPGRLAAAPLALAAAVRMGDKHRQAIVCNRANRIAGVLLCVTVVALLIYAEYWIFYVYLPSPRSSARGKPDA